MMTQLEGRIKNQVVVDVSCGYDFSVFLLDTGKVNIKKCHLNLYLIIYLLRNTGILSLNLKYCQQVITWGNNDKGQLGINRSGGSYNLVEVFYLQTYYDTVIEKIVCGRSHVIALSETGTLYAWGSNASLQLGISNVSTRKYGCPLEVEVDNLR